jgi:hypothetical protein
MLVQVTQDDIDAGLPCVSNHCPVALALNRATGCEWDVQGNGCCGIRMKAKNYFSLNAPNDVAYFVEEFDDGLPVEPFEFELDWSKE